MLVCTGTDTPASPNDDTEILVPEPCSDSQIRKFARLVMSGPTKKPALSERRGDLRQPFPYPFQLTPFDNDGPREQETFGVLGKHISERGVDFYHSEAIPHRQVIASFECEGEYLGLVLELTWCRFGRHGWYENGGRFVRTITSPLGT